jgi:hypothetical protein
MSIKSDILAAQNALNEAHEDGPSQALDNAHRMAWDLLLRHYVKLGLTRADLREIHSRGNIQAFGGGTGKTPPPEPDG